MNGLVFTYSVPGDDFTRAGEASSAIKLKLRQLGVPPATVKNVAIATYEGEINMIIHAPGNGRLGGGVITVTVDGKKITVVLKDEGRGIADVELAMKEGFTTAPDEIRSLGFGAGMGLPNMKKYADEFDLSSEVGKGTTVTLSFDLA